MGYVTPRALGAFTAAQIAQENRDEWTNIHDVQYPESAGWTWRDVPGSGGLLIQAYNTRSGIARDTMPYKPYADMSDAEILALNVASLTASGAPEAIDTLADFHDHATGDPRLTEIAQTAISILQTAGADAAAANALATQSHPIVLDQNGQWTPDSTSREYFPAVTPAAPASTTPSTAPSTTLAIAGAVGSPTLPGVNVIDIHRAASAPVLLDDAGASASPSVWKAIGIAAGIGALIAIANHQPRPGRR